MKKAFSILSIVALFNLVLIVACSDDDDCGSGGSTNRFKVNDISLSNLKLEDPTLELTNHTLVAATPQDVLSEKEYFIAVNLITENYTAHKQSPKFSLVESAYACSPMPPYSDETILSLTVRANKDFSSAHPAGADLTELFDVVVFNAHKGIYYSRMSVSDYIASQPSSPNKLYLVLNTAPEKQDSFNFEVSYHTSLKGQEVKIFKKQTPEVNLVPSV